MEEREPRGSFDHSSAPVERKSEREEAPVWAMLPIFAIVGALLAILAALTPVRNSALFFVIPTVAAFLIGGALLVMWNRRRMR